MPNDTPKFLRLGEEARRETLIEAMLDLVAEHGVSGATVRAVAARAGVTPGLIRHYFGAKEALTRAAYAQVMTRMTTDNHRLLDGVTGGPKARLAHFVAGSLRPPVVDPLAMGLWAGFLHRMRADPAMREVHETQYLAYRDLLQSLIADLGRAADDTRLRADAIACNGVIDGLWLEGSALPDAFGADELPSIGVRAVGAILGVDLMEHWSPGAGTLSEDETR